MAGQGLPHNSRDLLERRPGRLSGRRAVDRFEVRGDLPPVLLRGVLEGVPDQVDQADTVASGKAAATESGSPFNPSQMMKKTSSTPRLRSSVSTCSQNFAD